MLFFCPELCLWVGLGRTCVVGSQAQLGAWDNERWAFSLDTYRPALPTQANIIARYRHLGSSHWDSPSEQRLELTWEKEEQGWEWAPVETLGASPTSSPLSGRETWTKTHFDFSRIEEYFGVGAVFWSVACKGCIAFMTRIVETSWCDGVVAGQEPSPAPPVPPCVASLEGRGQRKWGLV